ncbi:MAG: hypothetical protein HOM96_04525 [Rickettsiales bacterium]|jgi:hypothetical protein|nr:hypothetical protein [Rickettsiales bacterium]
MIVNKKNNIINFEDLKIRSEAKEPQVKGCAATSHNIGICRIIYKDLTINFWHKNNAYTCNVDRGN